MDRKIWRVDTDLLDRAQRCWENWAEYRADRERAKRFAYGDQWGDLITDFGVSISEEEYIRSHGNMPLKNNLIRRLVRNVLGVWRNQWELPRCVARDPAERGYAATINKLLRCNAEENRLEELYSRTLEEFLIGGLAVHKKWYGMRGGKSDCRTDIVIPDRFFLDSSSRDLRGEDVSLVGEIHRMSFATLAASFAADPEMIRQLERIYGLSWKQSIADQCTVYEIWHRENVGLWHCHDLRDGRFFKLEHGREDEVARENLRRRSAHENPIKISWNMEDEWRYSFLAADGTVLREGVTPYRHGMHPYVFKAYPFIDGEIHSFVSDVIDQQKLTNRLISMYDWILRASAKGVLLFPEGSLPAGADINDIAEEWSRFNGVIVYRPKVGVPIPQQVSSNSTDIGITQLLEIQMKMMEDISGVNGALQGKLDSNSMSGTLYNQQTQNSLTALADLLGSFNDFVQQGTKRDMSNMRQFYSDRFVAAVAGTDATIRGRSANYFDPRLDFRIE